MSTEPLRLADGRRLRWWEGGDPDGLPVIFCHGCPDTRHAAMPGDGAARRAGVRLIAVNRPGYDGSDAYPSDHLTVADDLVEAAALLGVERFSLLGMSVGGGYALACAARHPDQVAAVALVASPADATRLDPPTPRDGLDTDGAAFFARIAGSASAEEAVELMRPDYEDFVRRVRADDPDDRDLADRWLAGLPPADAELVSQRGAASVAASVREALADPEGYLRDAAVTFRPWAFRVEDVACPVSLWYGAADPQTAVRNATALAARLSRPTLHVHDTTAHLETLLTQWDPVLAELGSATRASLG
ncbi:MAG: alpha/beta hydrolase [Nocardioidaceae bacterium]